MTIGMDNCNMYNIPKIQVNTGINKQKTSNIKKPSGYFVDYAILNLAMSTIKASTEDKDKEVKGASRFVDIIPNNKSSQQELEALYIDLADKFNKLNKKLTKQELIRIDSLTKKMIAYWAKITPIDCEIILDLFATYLIICNFLEKRKKPFHIDFNFIAHNHKINEIMDLISDFYVESEESLVEYEQAKQIVLFFRQ
jgi:hypothetical protein